jgi:FtsH-binding integral membrane protein
MNASLCATNSLARTVPVTPEERITAVVVFALSLVCTLANFAVFLHYKPRFQRLRVRITFFYFFYGLAAVFMLCGLVLPAFSPRVPCWLQFAFCTLGVAGMITTNLTRSSAFMLYVLCS